MREWVDLLKVLVVIEGALESLVNHNRREKKRSLEDTEVGVLWQVQNWLLFVSSLVLLLLDFLVIVLVVEYLNETLSDEVHLLDVGLVANDNSSWS